MDILVLPLTLRNIDRTMKKIDSRYQLAIAYCVRNDKKHNIYLKILLLLLFIHN